jgi:3-oxoisoapionate kinase
MALVSFVADDLTGASDVLAQAHRYGLDAVLAVGDGTGSLPEDADVAGIAGPSRSLGGADFDALVRAQLARIVSADVVLYKVCSTFDSSPWRGSIGRAIELLHERFPGHGPVPVVPAQPDFGRYTAFSEHFAAYDGRIFRLDRHPVMSVHPSTPMDEADLRRVLARQFANGDVPGGLQLPGHDSFAEEWARHRAARSPAFVVDATEDRHLDAVAHALRAEKELALVVGSGGIMAALGRTATGRPSRVPGPQRASGPVLAVSASASSTTAAQIDHVVRQGWAEVPLPPELLSHDDPELVATVEKNVAAELKAGRHVVVHSTRGTTDPRYEQKPVEPAHLGALLGGLAARTAEAGLTRDIAVCGGDTSSHALAAMGVRQLRVLDQFVTAGPVCRSDEAAPVAGCRLLLKGGQVGPTDVLARFAGHS